LLDPPLEVLRQAPDIIDPRHQDLPRGEPGLQKLALVRVDLQASARVIVEMTAAAPPARRQTRPVDGDSVLLASALCVHGSLLGDSLSLASFVAAT